MPEKTVRHDKGYARFRAIIDDGKGGHAEATKTETAASFPDYTEKAETGAVGRALALLGYGTAFTGDELNEEHRIVDAPVERAGTFQQVGNGNGRATATTAANGNSQPTDEKQASTPATEQQLASLRKLCQHLGKPEPEGQGTMSYLSAKELILQYSREYNEQRQSRKAS